jgi:hypothetical protein
VWLTPRTLNTSTIGNDLLDHLANFGPQIEALIVYNSNLVAVPESPPGARPQREDLFRLEQFQTDADRRSTTCCLPPLQLSTDIHTSHVFDAVCQLPGD